MPRPPIRDFFYPLSPRLTALLSTMFTRSEPFDLALIDFLNDDDSYVVREKAELALALDASKRAALFASEMRRQVQLRGVFGLDQIDPSWLLAALHGEQPTTIGIILSQLSANVRKRVLSELPAAIRSRVPAREALKGVRLEVMRTVRQTFEAKFAAMPMPPSEPTNLYFKDLVLLDGRELMQVIRAVGIDELAAAFLTVGKRKLAELCTRLGKDAAEELILAVKQTEARDAMDLADSNALLKRLVLGLKLHEARGTSIESAKERFQRELFQKAGLLRLARGFRRERPGAIQQIAQRLPRTHGRLLVYYVSKIHDIFADDDVKLRRLQDLILARVEQLAARGKVSPRYLKFSFCYWGDEPPPEEELAAENENGEADDRLT